MITLSCILYKFGDKGEKTGWTYLVIPKDIALKLNPTNKKSFRAKGTMDAYTFQQIALIPMGEGEYIIPINAEMRKALKKKEGDIVALSIAKDNASFALSSDMMICLKEDETALAHFQNLNGSHQKYFSKWVDGAKSIDTKTKRIGKVFFAMQNKMDFAQMIRYFQAKN